MGIEVAQSDSNIVVSQRKYALDILEDTSMLDYKPINTHTDLNIKLFLGQGKALIDLGKYWRLVGKLNYLTITRSNISFDISMMSQFLLSPCNSH